MVRNSTPLKDRLNTWVTKEYAAYQVGVCFGKFTEFGAPPWEDPWHGTKYDFLKPTALGKSLFSVIDNMVSHGLLELSKDKKMIRWNQNV